MSSLQDRLKSSLRAMPYNVGLPAGRNPYAWQEHTEACGVMGCTPHALEETSPVQHALVDLASSLSICHAISGRSLCMHALRQALKGSSEDEVDAVLDRVMMLFR